MKKMSKMKGIMLTKEELEELNKKAERMHLSTSRLMVLGVSIGTGRSATREINEQREAPSRTPGTPRRTIYSSDIRKT